MKLIEVNTEAKTATVNWNGEVRTLEYQQLKEDSFSIPIAGTVGHTGTKLWFGRVEFYRQGEGWIRAGAYGGLNGKVFRPGSRPGLGHHAH